MNLLFVYLLVNLLSKGANASIPYIISSILKSQIKTTMKRIFFALALTISVTSFAQLSFQKGQKLEVVTDIKKTSSLELMGQAIESKVNATLTEMFDVTNSAANAFTIEHKVKRLVFDAEGMQGKQTFDSEKEGDRSGEIGKLVEKALKNKYTMTLDATGKVTAVKLDDDNPKGNSEADAVVGLISMQTGANLATPKAGDVTEFKILPAKTLKQSDTWTDTSSAEGTKEKTIYTVKSVSDNEITLDYTKETSISTKQMMMGTEASVNGTNKAVGTAVVDKKTGILKTKTETIDSDMTLEAQGQSIPVKEKSTRTITVKPA